MRTYDCESRCCLESLEDRMMLSAASSDIVLTPPAHAYEGRWTSIDVSQPADAQQRVKYFNVSWGDGQESRGRLGNRPLKHIYDIFGSYQAVVTGLRLNGDPFSTNLLINVQNLAPRPQIEGLPAVVPFQPVTFDLRPGDSAPQETLDVAWSIVGVAGQPFTAISPDQPKVVPLDHVFDRVGRYRIRVAFRDSAGAIGRATTVVRVVPIAAQPDPLNRGQTVLVVGGTTGNDQILFRDRWSGLDISINGESYGFFSDPDRIIAYGGDGNDVIAIDGASPVAVSFYGGTGNDVLAGGAGKNVLDGGSGTNRLIRG